MVCLIIVTAFPSMTFLHVFPGFIARPFRGVRVGFEEPHLRFMVLLGDPGFPQISHISAYAAHQGGLVLWYGLGRPVITSEIGNWSVFVFLGWCFVFGIIMKRDWREPHIVRCHHGSGGINKAASLSTTSSEVL